ncbi:peptidoglycan-binding domain-containing protein [Clostridium niameyense]|uniref:peptidoglycan-binding domain-containing protein n=1 Tax=Clostridium niameyense TaxID=1622073 RepID=UPI00242BA55C|nr:peptidoglycan-binding domain-containing protein [Clostridium niameyense]
MFFGDGNVATDNSTGGSYYNVKEVQEMLIKIGYPCGNYGADGSWGNSTKAAVECFQRDCNLKVDGWVGGDTYRKIKEEYNKKLAINKEVKQKVKEEYDMDKIILYYGDMDALSALLVGQKNSCPVMKESDFEKSGLKAKKVIRIGGPNGDATGKDRFKTFKAAANLV